MMTDLLKFAGVVPPLWSGLPNARETFSLSTWRIDTCEPRNRCWRPRLR